MKVKHISYKQAATHYRRFRNGQPITNRDVRFANAVRRAIMRRGATIRGTATELGHREAWLQRIVNLKGRPSFSSAMKLIEHLGFTEGQIAYHGAYLRSLND